MDRLSRFFVSLWRRYNSYSLILRILIGLITGAALGFSFPDAAWIGKFGTAFVGALKALAPVLVFTIVAAALAQDSARIDSRFTRVIFLYMLTTLCASILSVVMSLFFPVTIQLTSNQELDAAAPESLKDVFSRLIDSVFTNPVTALADANYIGILFWAILAGAAMKLVGSPETKRTLADAANAISLTVRWIVNLAPLGVLGLVYTSIRESGAVIFICYGKIVCLLVVVMLIQALVVSPAIAYLYLRQNPWPLVWRCLKNSGVTAFFTRSSAANIPVNMSLCEQFELDRDFYSLSIPLGSTINMNGAAITITIMTLAAAHSLGIHASLPLAILLSFLGALGACGASGVAGGSLLLIPMACSLFGISNDVAMQVVGVGFIIGVIQDSFETALNSSGDVLFTAVAEFSQWRREGKSLPDFMNARSRR